MTLMKSEKANQKTLQTSSIIKLFLKDSFSGTEVKSSLCLIPVFNTHGISSLTLKDIAESTAKVIAAQQKSLDSLAKVLANKKVTDPLSFR